MLIGGAAIVLIVILAALGSDPDRQTSSARTVATTNETAAHVSAALLYDQYQTNEVNADNYYKDRLVAVSGRVSGIKKNFSDSIYLELQTSNEFESVQAHLADGQAGNASALYKSASVALVCRGAGMIMGSPQLKDCTIQ